MSTFEKARSVRGQRKTQLPCVGCGLHEKRCICDQIVPVSLRTRLTLLVHTKELRRTTNTGQLAVRMLLNSQLLERGRRDQPLLSLVPYLNPEYRHVLLFPGVDSELLTPQWLGRDQRPVQLIVPDGNWRQASKVRQRHPELQNLECIRVAPPADVGWHLRREHMPDGMATLEAIALAFEVLEGRVVSQQLMTLYRLKLHGTLLGRGQVMPGFTLPQRVE